MEKNFITKHFHLWPFESFFFNWRGFHPTYTITVSNENVILNRNGKLIKSFMPNEIEACTIDNTWFGRGALKISLAHICPSSKEKRGDHWYSFWKEVSYISKKEKYELINTLKAIEPKCFNKDSISMSNDTLWMGNQYIFDFHGYKNYHHMWGLSIPEIKYFYTQKSIIPFKKPTLVTGSDHSIIIKDLSRKDVEALKQHVISNGSKLGEVSNVSFKDVWHPSVIFSPKLWSKHVSVGLGDNGVTCVLKTRRTEDNIFLPYDKINFAFLQKKWYWIFTRKLAIYGEQNIVPKRRLSTSGAKRIIEELREKGVNKFEGKKYKRLVIGDKKVTWTGKISIIDFDTWMRVEPKDKLKFWAGDASDICAVVFRKKHWYYLIGHLHIWARPRNIRWFLSDDHGGQHSQSYHFEIKRVFPCTASSIRKALINAGYQWDNDNQKRFKKWIKAVFK